MSNKAIPGYYKSNNDPKLVVYFTGKCTGKVISKGSEKSTHTVGEVVTCWVPYYDKNWEHLKGYNGKIYDGGLKLSTPQPTLEKTEVQELNESIKELIGLMKNNRLMP